MSEPSHHQKPEWTPADAGPEYAGFVMKGVDGPPGKHPAARRPRRRYSAPELLEGIKNGNRSLLSRAITMIESNAHEHREIANQVVQECLPLSGNSIRVGITGIPGAGKSTFIETLGTRLCQRGKKVAVLAVDPTSSITKGSVLGDKTRMEHLSREPDAFIRPSPTGGNLGGVTRKSRETIVLCEAAGFDVILVETVGVGQNETTVRSMVDFFLLLTIAGGGDELQGIKKGVVELADAILINKADGDNIHRAEAARQEAHRALHYLDPATPNWKPRALTCSAIQQTGIDAIWEVIETFRAEMESRGQLADTRNRQRLDWMLAMVEQQLITDFHESPAVREHLPSIRQRVVAGQLPASAAASALLEIYRKQ